MKFPNIISTALIVGVLAVLQHLLLHVGDFHLPELYAPIIVAVLTALVKAVQEWNPPLQPEATERGMESEPTPSYWKRVLYK